MSSQPDSPVCPACGAEINPQHRFCAECGAPIERAVPPVEEDRRLATVLYVVLPDADEADIEPQQYQLVSIMDTIGRRVRDYGGTIGKYGPEGVMAFFGAPVGQEDSVDRAMSAALALRSDLAPQSSFALQIGIETGQVVTGPVARDVQSARTVVGQAVPRSEQLAMSADVGEVLVGPIAARLGQRNFELEQVAIAEATKSGVYRLLHSRDAPLQRQLVPMVARERELQFLHSAFEHVGRERGLAVTIVAEPGVGKSRLVGEFLSRVDKPERVVARCASFAGNSPYTLIAALVRAGFGLSTADPEDRARETLIKRSVSLDVSLGEPQVDVLLNILGYGDRFPYDPANRRPILAAVLRSLLARLCERLPLVLVIEDLQWADAPSLEIVAELVRELASAHWMLIGTSRPGWTCPWTAESIELQPLRGDDARSLAETLVGCSLSDSLAAMIQARTGGNPFFVEELIQSLRESDALLPSQSEVDLRVGAVDALPMSVQAVIQARLDRLQVGPKEVAHGAAICGRQFEYAVLERTLHRSDIARDLTTLETDGFVVAVHDGSSRYMFRHGLIQEVAYHSQLRAHRRKLHGRVAAALEALNAERVDELADQLAFHYGRSDDDAKAAYWLTRAGERARALYANQEALDLYAAALERARGGDETGAIGILERIGDVQTIIGRYDDAITSFNTARETSPNVNRATVARLLRKTGTALRIRGARQDALEVLHSALREIESTGDAEEARINLELGQLLWRGGEFAAAKHVISKAVEQAVEIGDAAAEAEGLKQLGNIPLYTGDARETIAYLQRSKVLLVRLEDVPALADVCLNLGAAHGRLGEWDKALAELQTSLGLFERIGDVSRVSRIHNNIGELHRIRGEHAEAIAGFEKAASIADEFGMGSDGGLALTGLGAARIECGQVDQGREDLLEAERRLLAAGASMYLPDVQRFLATAELAIGDLAAAGDRAERSLELARSADSLPQIALAQRVLGEIELARGNLIAAAEFLEASKSALTELGDVGELAHTQAVLERLDAGRHSRTT
jgi:adenylate cyclase